MSSNPDMQTLMNRYGIVGRNEALREALALDPRPPYQDDPDRVYGMSFAGRNVRFRVRAGTLSVLSVRDS